MAAEGTRARYGAEQAEHVPSDRMQPLAARELALDIGDERFERRAGRDGGRRLAEQFRIDREQPPRLAIGRAAHHRPVDQVEVTYRRANVGDTAVDDDVQMWVRCLEAVDARIIERRNLAV